MDLEFKLCELFCNFGEMAFQSWTVQGDHWQKANQVTVASGQRADQKRKQCSGRSVCFVAEVAATAVVDPLGSVHLAMNYVID